MKALKITSLVVGGLVAISMVFPLSLILAALVGKATFWVFASPEGAVVVGALVFLFAIYVTMFGIGAFFHYKEEWIKEWVNKPFLTPRLMITI